MLHPMLNDVQRQFLDSQRVGRLATVSPSGTPHVIPVCYGIGTQTLYITIDEKPKRHDIPLQRLRNIAANPSVAVVVDHWDEDWSRLAWIMLTGSAEILLDGAEHDGAQEILRNRYKQYQRMELTTLPVIAVRITRIRSWGAL